MLHTLPSVKQKSKRRVGRGHGSGRAKTSGRGTKGQNARSNRPLSFEGGALPLIKRLPFHRGKGRNKIYTAKPIAVDVAYLNVLPANSEVDIEALIKHKIVLQEVREYGVKILGDGELNIPLIVKLPASKGAKTKIEKAGGKVEVSA